LKGAWWLALWLVLESKSILKSYGANICVTGPPAMRNPWAGWC
jgi:hypothetical protein